MTANETGDGGAPEPGPQSAAASAQDWVTIWQTELAGMAADPDHAARMAHALRAWQALAAPFWGGLPPHEPWPSTGAPRAEAVLVASLAERLDGIERRLAELERTAAAPAPAAKLVRPARRKP